MSNVHPILQQMFDNFYPLMKAQTEHEIAQAEEGVQRAKRLIAHIDSVPSLSLPVIEEIPHG